MAMSKVNNNAKLRDSNPEHKKQKQALKAEKNFSEEMIDLTAQKDIPKVKADELDNPAD